MPYLFFLNVYFFFFAIAWAGIFGYANAFLGGLSGVAFIFMTFFVVMWIGSDIGELRRKKNNKRLFGR